MTLRTRVRLLVLLMTASSALLLGLVLFVSDEWVEDAAVRDLLNAEMDSMLATGAHPAERFDGAVMLQYLRPVRSTPAPARLAALAPGVTQDLDIDGRAYWVLTREVTTADRAYIIYHADRIERREHRLWITAALAALLMALLALAYGGRLATFALAPFDHLVRQIRALDPGRRGQRLPATPEDREIDVIRASLNTHLEEVDALIEHERAFSAAASHELRGPLSVIHGSAEVLRASASDSQRATVDRLGRAARQTHEIMEALLALSRRDDNPGIESLALTRWLPEAAEAFLRDASAIHVRWQLEPVTLVAQAGAARVVFTNLLRNAIQATGEGEIRIALDATGVTLEDDGPGIPPEALAHLFEPGFRLHDGGSGMGLYIARAVAARNGWSISVANRGGGGARACWRFAP